MGLLESIKNIMAIQPEDEFDEELEEMEEREEQKKRATAFEQPKRTETTPRILGGGKAKTVSYNATQMQVVLVKPERYEDVTSIADHLNEGKSVVLNLESTEKDVSRRIVDFLSGATYANHGNMRKVSKGTFLIVPHGVDMMGEMILDDFDDGKMYF